MMMLAKGMMKWAGNYEKLGLVEMKNGGMVGLVSVVDAPLLDPGVEGEGGAGLSRVAPVRGLRPLILTTHSENTLISSWLRLN